MTSLAEARETTSLLPRIGIAIGVLVLIAIAVFEFNPHKVADLSITRVDTFSPKVTEKPKDPLPDDGIRVIDEPVPAALSDLYVIVTPRLTDDLRLPIFVTGAVLTITAGDGSQTELHAIDAVDLPRLTNIFPQVAAELPHPVKTIDEIAPGQAEEGQFVFQMPSADAAIWNGRKDASLTLELRNQAAQTVKLPGR